MAPVDPFHATVEFANALPIVAGQRLVDIGCGISGPARHLAQRFGCKVDGLDITAHFGDAGNKLSAFVGMQDSVTSEVGDGQKLPYALPWSEDGSGALSADT